MSTEMGVGEDENMNVQKLNDLLLGYPNTEIHILYLTLRKKGFTSSFV